MRTPFGRRGMSCLLAVMLLLSGTPGYVGAENAEPLQGTPSAGPAEEAEPGGVSADDVPSGGGTVEYIQYQQAHQAQPRPEGPITLTAADLAAAEDGTPAYTLREDAEKGTVCELLENDSQVTFHFYVQETGMYHLAILYKQAGEGLVSEIVTDILLDGTIPSFSMAGVSLPRYWKIEQKSYDSRGNELSHELTEAPQWTRHVVYDSAGRHNDPLEFYLAAGEHTVTLRFEKAGLLLSGLVFGREETPAAYERPDGSPADTPGIQVEGEDFARISDSSIQLGADSNNPAVSPSDPQRRLYNIVGGSTYATPQQSITWQVPVKQSGYYKLAFKVRQNINSGFFSTRCLRIDGEIPYAECRDIRFPYQNGWYNYILSDADGEAMLFYLEEGVREISLEVVPGDISSSLLVLQDCVDQLNRLLRQVMMVTGNSSDKYRDYYLEEEIPGLREELDALRQTLTAQRDRLVELSGEEGSRTSTIQTMITQLGVFVENPDDMALKLTSFKSNITALASWVNELTVQPLELDYLMVYGNDGDLPAAEGNFLENMVFTIRRLLASFLADYGQIGDMDADREYLKVWLSGGQEQLHVVQDLAGEYMSLQDEVGIKTELVTGTLLEAVMAGKGPDISLFQTSDLPVNLAARGELTDLTQFDGFDEAAARYRENALVPYRYNGGCYALPLSESFHMLFVRTDIFEEMSLEIPETWEELYELASVLQRSNLDVGIPSDLSTYFTLMAQKGGTLYADSLEATSLDREPEIQAFQEWTSLYTEKGFDLTYDFFNRFRTGEMPIGIAAYSTYTLLKVSAPEINGRWTMLPLIGTRREDGTVDRSWCPAMMGTVGLSQAGSCAFILKDCRSKEAAWDFLSWFTGDDAQTEYALQIEMRMGLASRYTPANYQVLDRLPWTEEEKALLYEQWDSLVLLPEVPGSYYVGRNLTYAFRRVVYNDDNPVYALNKYNEIINRELRRKLDELKKWEGAAS